MHKLIIVLLLTIFSMHSSWAGEAEDIAAIQARLDKVAPQDKPDSIKPSAVKGLYEVIFGSEVFYLSADGRYVLQGSLVDLENNENLTEASVAGIRLNLMNELDESQMIVFSPDKPRHTLTVFTDIDCGYCRKLHAEMDEYNSYGIKIRYMMFPRSGLNTPSFEKAVNVWCAEDQQVAMTKAKAGESVAKTDCENPIQSQWIMGQQMGVTGTPALVMDDGSIVPGYRPAKELAAILDAKNSK